MIKKQFLKKILIEGVILLILIISFLLICSSFINQIYLLNELTLIFYWWTLPTLLLFASVLFLKIFLNWKKSFFSETLKALYFLFPIGFIYSLANEFYFMSQHNWQNIVLNFGLIFIFILLYTTFAEPFFWLLNNKRKSAG